MDEALFVLNFFLALFGVLWCAYGLAHDTAVATLSGVLVSVTAIGNMVYIVHGL